MYRTLPSNAYLKDIEREARDLLHALRRREASAFGRFQSYNPLAGLHQPRLAEAQYIVAREYGYSSWRSLKEWLATR